MQIPTTPLWLLLFCCFIVVSFAGVCLSVLEIKQVCVPLSYKLSLS